MNEKLKNMIKGNTLKPVSKTPDVNTTKKTSQTDEEVEKIIKRHTGYNGEIYY